MTMKALRELVMRRGPIPAVPPPPPTDDPEVQAAPLAREETQPAPSMPPTATRAAGPLHHPPDEGHASPQKPSAPTAAIGSDPAFNHESDHVRVLRERAARVRRQLDEEQQRLPDLAAAVATARTAAREREVQKVLAGTPEAAEAADESRRLLVAAVDAETTAIHAVGTLKIAQSRAARELEAAVEAHAQGEQRRVLAALQATAEKDRADLLVLLDRLWLSARIRGAHGSAQALLGTLYSTAIGGDAMIARTSALFRRLAAGEVQP